MANVRDYTCTREGCHGTPGQPCTQTHPRQGTYLVPPHAERYGVQKIAEIFGD